MPYNPHAYSSAGLGRYGFLATQYPYMSIETTDPRTVTVPDQPGIQSGVINTELSNADDIKRSIEQTTMGPVIQSSTSNLITCPNADGDVSLGCWIFSSDNDRFARKNLEVDTMPGEKTPDDIMVVPGNWMDLAGTTASPGNYSTVTPDLYNTEVLDSEQRIFTGVMMNSNTGQLYETYEDDVPPPNTDKKRLVPEQMSYQNPIVTALSGGWDPSMPKRHKVDVLEEEYGDDAGRNVWGSQLYATAIRDIAEQIDVKQQFNNRNGFVPVEPAWDKRAVGFVGYVSAYRGTPHMPPTQREARDMPDTFATSVRGIENLDIQFPAIHGTDLTKPDMAETNREAPAILSNESMSSSNFAPGRLEYRQAPQNDGFRGRSGVAASQIYNDGTISLKDERPISRYNNVPDAQAVQTVQRPHNEMRTIRCRDDQLQSYKAPLSAGFEGVDYEMLTPTERKSIQKIDKSLHNFYYNSSETPSQGNQRRPNANSRRVARTDQDPTNEYHNASDVPSQGNQIRPGADSRRTWRADTDETRARNSGDTALIGARDGRPADEEAFLASIKLVQDSSSDRANALGVRNMDTLVTNATSKAATRLAHESQNSVRAQGLSTSINGCDTSGGLRVADWTSHVRDTSIKTTRRGPVEFVGQQEARLKAKAALVNSARGQDGFYRTHGPNSGAATASTLAGMDPYSVPEEEIYRMYGTRETSRGMRTVEREPVLGFG